MSTSRGVGWGVSRSEAKTTSEDADIDIGTPRRSLFDGNGKGRTVICKIASTLSCQQPMADVVYTNNPNYYYYQFEEEAFFLVE
jgi:hypothetical protein